jgi:uncharacterized iron-regulated membrane protein
MKLRTLVLTIHRSMGILLGLVFLVIGLTGSALVFYREINSWLNPQLMQVLPQGERLDIQVLINTVHSAFPHHPVHSIVFPRTPSGIYQMALEFPRENEWLDIFLNPYTGAILGKQQWGHTLISFIYSLHMSLLLKQGGDQIVGFCGLLLLVLVVSGLVVWPGWRNLVFGFWIRWKAPAPLLTYDLHKVGGLFSAVFLLLIAATGAAMVFSSQFQSLAYWLTNTPPITPPVSTVIANQAPIPLTEILRTADASLPEGATTLMLLPHDSDGVFEVYKKLPQDINYFGNSKVYIDQYSGKVLRVDNVFKLPLAAQMSNALLSLHNGTYGGLGMRCLYVFIGLVPPTLLITGIIMWRNRNRVKYYRTQK